MAASPQSGKTEPLGLSLYVHKDRFTDITKGGSMKRGNPNRKGLLLSIGGALLFLACASVVTMSRLSQDQRDRIQTLRFSVDGVSAPDSLLYSAALGYFADRGYSFQVTDKASGLIQTEPLMYPANENNDVLSETFVGAKFRWRRRVTTRVKDGTVRLSYVFETERKGEYYGESGWEIAEPDTSFSNSAYREAFGGISERYWNGKR